MLASVVAARVLGPEGKGQLALLILVPTTLIALGDLGIRQSSIYVLASKKHELDRVFSSVLSASALLGVLLFGIAVLAFQVLGDSILKGLDQGLFLLMISIVPLWLLFKYVTSIFRGLDRPLTYNVMLVLEGGLFLALIVGLFASLGGTLQLAVAARVASVAIVVVISVAVLWAQELKRFHFSIDKATVRALLGTGVQISLILSLGFLNRKLATFLVNGQLGNAEVGLFVIAASLAELVWLFPGSVGTILFPRICALSKEEANKTTPLVARLTVIVTTALAVALYLVSRPLIPFVYGDAFAPAITPLLILLPGVVLLSVHKVLWSDIMGRGRPLLSIFSRTTTLVILVTLVFLLVPSMGLAGVALATSVSYAVGTGVLVFVFSRHAGVPWASLVIPQINDFRLLLLGLQGFIDSALAGRRRVAAPAKAGSLAGPGE